MVVVVLSLFKLPSNKFITIIFKHFHHLFTMFHAWLCNFQF